MPEIVTARPLRIDMIGLHGKSILLVEDQILIAMDVEQALTDFGLSPVHTAFSVLEAIQTIRVSPPDLAVLDFNLGEETSVDIARILRKADIPFLFATGCADPSMIPTEFQDVAIVRKPYAPEALIREMEKLIA